MKNSRVRGAILTMGWLGGTSWLRAHPGHDGHELTWDLSHLTAFPVATMVCFGFLAAAGWCGWWLLRRSTTLRIQSLRRSQDSRGK